jgi:hypothetical protein
MEVEHNCLAHWYDDDDDDGRRIPASQILWKSNRLSQRNDIIKLSDTSALIKQR